MNKIKPKLNVLFGLIVAAIAIWAIANELRAYNYRVGGIAFVLHPLAIPAQLNLPWFSVRPLGIMFLLLIASYFLGSCISRRSLIVRGHQFRFPSLSLALAQIAVSSLDWSLAAAVVYSLLPTTTLLYSQFLGIYLLAMTAGVISNVPGGLGVFESVIVLILAPQVSAAAVLGSLLVYRAVYYLLPLTVAIVFVGLYEVRMRFQHS